MNRSLRNIIARGLMEGYDETVEQYRFALLSADIVLEAIPNGSAKVDGEWIRITDDGVGYGEFDRMTS